MLISSTITEKINAIKDKLTSQELKSEVFKNFNPIKTITEKLIK